LGEQNASQIKMLARSGKSRLAATALMALGASTFMGTSAAKATEIEVTGSVGTCEVSSTVTASDVSFGSLEPGDFQGTTIRPSITQGKTSDCEPRDSSVTASLGSFSDNATAVQEGNKVMIYVIHISGGRLRLSVDVPETATVGQAFSAILTLTLSD
jgi:hypothetical protein